MSSKVWKRAYWYVGSTKTQSACTPRSLISLPLCILGYQKCTQWRFWSDCKCTSRSKSSLGAHVQRYIFWVGSNVFQINVDEMLKFNNHSFLAYQGYGLHKVTAGSGTIYKWIQHHEDSFLQESAQSSYQDLLLCLFFQMHPDQEHWKVQDKHETCMKQT